MTDTLSTSMLPTEKVIPMRTHPNDSIRTIHWALARLTLGSNQWAKRGFDILCALVGLLLLAPLLATIAAWIRLSSPGPVIYYATRVGRNGKLFHLYKFRTMRQDADRTGPGITRSDDDRITPVGRLLRKSKLDELPQLLNVLKGEMSLVGPRPEDPRYVAHYTPHERVVLSVRPGVTSLASIRYRNEESLLQGENWEDFYLQHVMRDKLRVDSRYIEKWSFSLDLRILFFTFFVLSNSDDAYLL